MVLNANFLKGWGGPAELAVFEALGYERIAPSEIIKNELGQGGFARFKAIEEKPFATGSFAQVYKATLDNDQQVIVKVLRPRLIKTLKRDLRSLGFLVWFVNFFKASSMFNSRSLFKNFAEMTISEVSYKDEVSKAKWFWKHYRDHPQITVPWTYEELSSERLITQDFVSGLSLAELMEHSENGYDPVKICEVSLKSDFWYLMEVIGQDLVHTTLWSDYMFGDPHPGNIKFLPSNKIGLIDFGLVVETAANKRSYLELLESYKMFYDGRFDPGRFMVATIGFFDEKLAKALKKIEAYRSGQTGFMFSGISKSAAGNFIDNVGNNETLEGIDKKRIIQVFNTAINDGNRFGLKMNLQSAGMIKSARAYILMLRKFNQSNQEEIIMSRILGQEIEFAKANLANLPQVENEESISLENAIEVLGDWLTQIADNDPDLYYNLRTTIKVNSYA